MPEETQVVEAAPSAIETPSLEIPRSNTPEYQQWRETGNLPDKSQPTKTEEAAPSTPSDNAGESETPQRTQEKPKEQPKPKQTAEERIAQLEATIAKIREGSEKKKPQAESAPAKTEPAQQQPRYTRPRPTGDETNPDGSPVYKDFNDVIEAITDWKEEQREAARQEAAASKAFDEIREKAEAKYENFAEVVGPFATVLNEDQKISPVVRRMFLDSDVTADLLYTIGSDAAEQAKFLKMAKDDPGKAIRYVAKVESLIEAELSAPAETNRNEKGQFAKEPEAPKTPAKRGPESAPAPPLEIGSRGTGAVDESDRALQAIERGDGNAVRAFFDAENRKDLSRRSGR